MDTKQDIHELIVKYNNNELSFIDLELLLKCSKKTVQRMIKKAGYFYNRDEKKYELGDINMNMNETTATATQIIEKSMSEALKNNDYPIKKEKLITPDLTENNFKGRPKTRLKDKEGRLVNLRKLTVEIDKDIYRALHMKKIDDNISINKYVQEAIRKALAKDDK